MQQLRRTLKGVHRGDPAAVHDARIATRRLSELVPLSGLDPDQGRRLLRRLRKLRRRLSRLRDVDAEILLLDKLMRVDRVSTSYVHLVREAIRVHAGDRSRRRDARHAAGRLKRVLVELDAIPQETGSSGATRARERAFERAARARVVRRAGRVRREVRDSGALYEPDRLHRARIAVKKLRYSLEVVQAIQPGFAADLRQLKRLQGTLGRLHDAQMVLDRVRGVQDRVHSGSPTSEHDAARLRSFLETRCRTLHGKFMRDRDALVALCGRLAASSAAARAERRRAG